jgi:tetratricopeptide (TPR) repeat protein
MAGALRWFWAVRGYLTEGRMWLELGLVRAPQSRPAIRGRALVALVSLAQFTYFQGDKPRARELFTQGLAMHRAVGDPLRQAFALSALGALALYRKELDAADVLLEQAIALTERADDPEVAASMAASTVSSMAGSAYARGDLARAAELAEEALERHRALGHTIRNLHLSANIGRDRGDFGLAFRRYQESLGLAQVHDDQRYIHVLLEGIARIAATTGQPGQAARLLAAAGTLRERTGYLVRNPMEPNTGETEAAAARAAMGEQALEAAWAAGRDLSRDRAIAEALAIVLPEADTPLVTSRS